MNWFERLKWKWENSIVYEILSEDLRWYDVHLSNGKMMHIYMKRSEIRAFVRSKYPKEQFPHLRVTRVVLAEYPPA